MLSFCTIVPDTLELLRRLTQEPFLKDCRLVGGTALALQYGHRSSIDLDFFGGFDIDGQEMHEILKTSCTSSCLDWNPGNHFADSDRRLAKGIAWMLNKGKLH